MKNTLHADAILAFLLIPLAANAQQFGDFTYSSDGTAITITRYYGPGGAVNIPSAINGLPVTVVGSSAFNRTSVTSVMIPGTVTSIQASAFGGCSNLTSVNIPGGVTNIGDSAFWACTSLTTVTIPAAVVRIGGGAFQSSGLTSITIPDSVNSIGDEAFGTCTSLTNFNIPTNVTRIGPFTFIGCGSLTSVTIPGNVRTIEDNAFSFCSNLTSVTISEGVTGILFQTFYRSDKLTNMVIPRSVTSIVRSPFPTGPGLQGLFFKGNAPIVLLGLTLATNTTVYYLPGATGWGATFGGVPARLWNPGIQTSAANFGVRTNRFGFNITGTPNIPIVLEAAADLGGAWTVLRSLNLTNGLFYFSDPAWINHPARTYRIRSP